MFDTGYLMIIPELLPDTIIIIAIFGFNTRLLVLCTIIVACMSKKRNVRLWSGFTCLRIVKVSNSCKPKEFYKTPRNSGLT